MRESRTYGSVRGALSNERPYRDRLRLAMTRWRRQASPAVSNIAASIASRAPLPAHTTNWNA
jgi:hypothetical protein